MTANHKPVITAIHEGLDKLLAVRHSPYAQNIFQTDKYVRDQKLFAKIKRLQISLENFDAADQGIGLIALIGHFSAGKSSTINAVLNIWGTPWERKTGRDPTDRKISVICLPENREQFRSLEILPGGDFTVEPIQHDLLRSVCLVDTPGVADPELQATDESLDKPIFDEETVRDFLPACDHVIYVFNGTNPFDTADIPALRMLADHLPFLPVTFVLTRANDYRIDESKPVSKENIDSDAVAKEMGSLKRRLAGAFGRAFSADDSILIDTKSGYAIDNLSSRLKVISESVSRYGLRESKLAYYGKRAESLRRELLAVVEENLKAWTTIWDDLEVRRDEWEEAVSGWQGVRNSWDHIRSLLDGKRVKYSDQNKASYVAPQNWRSIPEFTRRIHDLDNAIQYSADSEANRIAKSHLNRWASRLSTHVAHLAGASPITPDQVDSWRSTVIESLAKFECPEGITRLEESLSLKYFSLLDGASGAVKDFAGNLTSRHKRISIHLTHGQQADELSKDVENGFDTTRTIIVRFMHLVGKLAQAIIFARDSTLFDTLGISKNLFDALRNLSEEEIEKIGADVISELRKSPCGAREELRMASSSLYATLSGTVPKGFSVPAISLISVDYKNGQFFNQINEGLRPLYDLWLVAEQQRIEQFCKEVKDEYTEKQLRMSELNALWLAAQKSIKKLTIIVGCSGCMLGVGVYLLTSLEHFGMSTKSVLFLVLDGVVSSTISGWAGNRLSKRWFGIGATYPKSVSDVEANFHKSIGALIHKFKHGVSEFPVSKLTSIIQSGFVAHKESMLKAIGEDEIDTVFQQMISFSEAIAFAEGRYRNVLDAYCKKLEEFAGDPDLIEKALNQFSAEHWNNTLNRPLNVLEEVNQSLTKTRDTLSNIGFSPFH